MSHKRSRFVTPIYERMPREHLVIAFTHAYRLAGETPSDGLLLTFSTKDNLTNIADVLRPILTDRGVKALKNSSRLEGNTPIQMVTDRSAGSLASWDGPVLLVYPTKSMLDRIGDMRSVRAEIVAPFAMTEHIKAWIKAWAPTPILGAEAPSHRPLPALAIARGLEQIYANNGLVTMAEREEAIETFETIIHYAPEFTSDDLHAYLLGTLGWDGAAASEARSIFEDLVSGKKIRGRSDPSKQLWDYWSRPPES